MKTDRRAKYKAAKIKKAMKRHAARVSAKAGPKEQPPVAGFFSGGVLTKIYINGELHDVPPWAGEAMTADVLKYATGKFYPDLASALRSPAPPLWPRV